MFECGLWVNQCHVICLVCHVDDICKGNWCPINLHVGSTRGGRCQTMLLFMDKLSNDVFTFALLDGLIDSSPRNWTIRYRTWSICQNPECATQPIHRYTCCRNKYIYISAGSTFSLSFKDYAFKAPNWRKVDTKVAFFALPKRCTESIHVEWSNFHDVDE